MHIYYQWIPGAYSYMVACNLETIFWYSPQHVFSFKNIFENVVKYDAFWVVPIENSYAGMIYENIYHLKDFPVEVIQEYHLRIAHCLAWYHTTLSHIQKAYSHIQALMQCQAFLARNNIQGCERYDTAWAAQYVASLQDSSIAAICSEKAADLYGLSLLEKNIQDASDNITKFFIIRTQKNNASFEVTTTDKKMSILFKTKHIPWALYQCLWVFATKHIQIVKIESLPSKISAFEYIFFLECDIGDMHYNVPSLLKELSLFAYDIRLLWIYPVFLA